MEPMLGMIYLIPFNFASRDYLLCQGQVVSKDRYSGLYSLFGTTYGGDGQETFALPSLALNFIIAVNGVYPYRP